MIDWLSGLSAPLRYGVYVGGILLMFLVAVGVGVVSGLVFSWQPEQDTNEPAGSAPYRTLEDTMLETTGNPKNADLHKFAEEVSFIHHATDENSRGDYTYINDPSINGDAKAIVLVAPSTDRANAGDGPYDHNIGVWYEGVNEKKWAIFNQDRIAIPGGAAFEVVIPPASQSFVHHAGPDNTISNSTYLDNPLTNGEPNAGLSVTQNWNPGGGRGVYNDHPIGVVYDQDVQKWAIYNQDGTPMLNGAAFNVAVAGNGEPAR
jgi:hypothetical protein